MYISIYSTGVINRDSKRIFTWRWDEGNKSSRRCSLLPRICRGRRDTSSTTSSIKCLPRRAEPAAVGFAGSETLPDGGCGPQPRADPSQSLRYGQAKKCSWSLRPCLFRLPCRELAFTASCHLHRPHQSPLANKAPRHEHDQFCKPKARQKYFINGLLEDACIARRSR